MDRRDASPILLALACGIALAGCSRAWRVDCDPADARIILGGKPARSGETLRLAGPEVVVEASRPGYAAYRGSRTRTRLLGLETIVLELEPELYDTVVDSLPRGAECRIDGIPAGRTPFAGKLAYGSHTLLLAAPGYPPRPIPIDVEGSATFAFRLAREAPPGIRPVGLFACGPAPKQVTFTPDGRRLHIALLSGRGFDILELKTRSIAKIEVPGFGADTGFVEGIFPEGRSTFLLSQMTRDMAHEFTLAPGAAPVLLRSIPTQGTWSKVIAYEPAAGLLAVSNWVSGDVTLLDYGSGSLVKRLRGLGTPRGLAFSPDGSSLAIASFGSGKVLRYDTRSWTRLALVERPGGALRHLVAASDGSRLFASDMARSEALELDARSLAVLHVYRTEPNPNTIDLGRGDRVLAVSCRGPNNPEGYLLRSPAPGTVLLFDTVERRLLARIEGGAQPTGLDISPDGRLLAFSNFQDATVEIYDISAVAAGNAGR